MSSLHYDSKSFIIPGTSIRDFWAEKGSIYNPIVSPKHLKGDNGFWILGWLGDYMVLHVKSGTLIELNSIRVKVEDDCIVHFPRGAMRATSIAVCPIPLSIEYRYGSNMEEIEKYRHNDFTLHLPDGSLAIVSNDLLKSVL